MSLEKKIRHAAELINRASYLVVFTGAGISTESGIPDFRGPNGVWTRRDKGLPPPNMPARWSEVAPNRGHNAIVELQNRGIMKFLISQNVDNLHLKSGIRRELIAEFHGNMDLMRCTRCDRQFLKDDIWDEEKWGKGYRASPPVPGQPTCECGGRIVSSVVNFGDPIPEEELKLSYHHSSMADVFLAVGSSLTVTPAAQMPMVAHNKGAQLIIINKQETPFDQVASLRFFEGAGEVLMGIVDHLKELRGDDTRH
jgi:mono-ADP-ribosyltransferase sirtuin 6